MRLCSHNLKIGLFVDGTVIQSSQSTSGSKTLFGPVGELYNQLIFEKVQRYFLKPLMALDHNN